MSLTAVPTTRPALPPQSLVPNFCPQLAAKPPHRRRVRVGHVYPQKEPEPVRHAKAILAYVQTWSPELIGRYVPQCELDALYRRDVCRDKGWAPRKWDAIGRELSKLTDKRTIKRCGERFTGYRVPKP
jgi:hypothetical protein